MDLARRMHRLGNELVGASVIQFTLNPVMLLLVVKPCLRKRIWTKCAATSLQQVDHCQGVVALQRLDS